MVRAMSKQSLWGRMAVGLCAVMVMAVSFVAIGPASSVSAVTCRNIVNVPQAGTFDDGSLSNMYQAYSATYTVPGSSVSGCVHINVTNVNTTGPVTDPRCGWFRVRFYPSSGGSSTNSWQYKCAPSGTVVAIATNVLNGTKYRVEWGERWNINTTFTIRD